ncbi:MULTISPECIES: 50S ribosomal protein L31 [Aliivibrio]|uniref:Large ribosomal subunit protein bL31 n=1 Tax=Aliivibrio finisterrensis TaxID=511998 RepID=A0A6N6RQB1_9GAMM|nr:MULTISPECIES: 50S ribosomal protein L31 [Aliivibrio]KAB2823740.1 50S ribosomal protein L31 [Aliivibrio finisterrensis]MDD9195195.1 50S ribosomal protein L31 [Aliivibrio sp. S3MY1]MDD9197759.1 50S ribosomal protein L31 [Aliivibrio sp. S2MY1]RYU69959.1 50S ribosomal protein L31 [Aliivibrio finisterrensis]RYU73748.1 50S ribosomal protein L31 [Aliivibrio finisterrensis]
MKVGIHPEYKAVQATCSCGNEFEFKSALGKDTIHLDVCGECHPFYTGKQRIVDTGGRVDRFNKRFGAIGSKK